MDHCPYCIPGVDNCTHIQPHREPGYTTPFNPKVETFEEAKARVAPGTIVTDKPTPSRYQWQWRGATFDFYRLCEIVGVNDHAQAHAMKKIIRAGKSIKPIGQDIDEAIAALQRWKEILSENAASNAERHDLNL